MCRMHTIEFLCETQVEVEVNRAKRDAELFWGFLCDAFHDLYVKPICLYCLQVLES